MTDPQVPPSDRGPIASREQWLGVELRHMAALEAIVREGSFRGAADSLGYVQSAISQQLSRLERLAGTRLLERPRGSAPIALTDAGETLLRHVEVILSRFEAAQSDLAALVEGEAGTVRVGTFQSVASRLVPHVLPGFLRSSPGVQVVPTETQTDLPLFDLVEKGSVDLAFCQLPLLAGPFESVELLQDPFVLLVSVDSPLADCDSLPLAELEALPLVGFNKSRAQRQMLEALEAVGIEPAFRFCSDLNATVQALVAGDIGAAIVPYLSVDPQHAGTTVVELPELPPRTISLIWHIEHELSPSAELFADAVLATSRRRFRHTA